MINEETKSKIKQLKSEGKRTGEIATALNLSTNIVRYWTNEVQREKQKAIHRTWFHTNYKNIKVRKLESQRQYYRNNKEKCLHSQFFSLLKGHLKRNIITKQEVLEFMGKLK